MNAMIINLTRQEINVIDGNGERMITFYPSSAVVECDWQPAFSIGPIPVSVVTKRYVVITNTYPRRADDSINYDAMPTRTGGLMPPYEGRFYIVPDEVRQAMPDRDDLLSPRDPRQLPDGTTNCDGFIANPSPENP